MTSQTTLSIGPLRRGCHLITSEVERALDEIAMPRVGLAHIFLLHTSASLTLNENASPDVRSDMEAALKELVPDGNPQFNHTLEGPDDMPAHVKSSLVGTSLTVPITDGQLHLGTWQGIYLNEHRNRGGSRRVVITVIGER